MAAEQLDLPGRAANELGFRRDHCLHDADLVMRRVDLLRLVAAGELQLLQRHDTLKRGRLALQDERVAGFQHHIAGGLKAALWPRE